MRIDSAAFCDVADSLSLQALKSSAKLRGQADDW